MSRAKAIPLADSMDEISPHRNVDHKDALVLLAREFARIDSHEAAKTGVCRPGFHLRMN